MKTKLFFFLLSIFIYADGSSQSNKRQKMFSVNIDGIIRNYTGSVVYLHHKWDDKDFTDSAKIDQGRFKFSLKSVEPNMYWITLKRELNTQPNFIFFADQEKIKLSLIGDSISISTVVAGITERDYKEYKNIGIASVKHQQQLQEEYTLAVQKGDQAAVANVQQQYQSASADYMNDLKLFIKNHPKSAVSGYIIYKEFSSPSMPIENAIECLGYMDRSMENTKFYNLASKRVNDIKGTQVGALATDFSQATADGKQVKLSDFRGQFVLIDFWASWCRPCRMENPNVVAAYNKFKDKGFTVFGVSLDTNKDQWVAAIDNDRLTWKNVSDLKGGSNEAATLYGIQSIPQNVLVDREGKIVAKNLRGKELDDKLNELFK